jgi:hypothetical protein
MLEPVLLGVVVSLAHEQGGVCHHLEQEAREGRAAEEDAACVQGLVILREEDVDVLDARGNRGGDVRGVPCELTVEDGRVARDGCWSGGRGGDVDGGTVRTTTCLFLGFLSSPHV